MRIKRLATTGGAALAAAAVLGLGAAGAASATSSTPGECTGTGPASTLSAAQHDAFDEEMTALKAQRDAIKATYGRTTRARQGTGQRARRTALTAAQRTAMQKELAAWRASRDALFAEYGLTARSQGRGA